MGRWIALVGVCVVAFGSTPEVHAKAKANRFLKKAKKAYENLDYTRVTPLLNRALKASKTDKEKIEIYYLLGTMHTIYSRDEQATEAFVEVLKRDPSFELPPDTSPKIRSAFAAAREQVPAPGDAPADDNVVQPGDDPAPPDEETEEEAPDDTETIEAAPVDEDGRLPGGLFGPTDEGMPGLSRRSRGSPWYTKWWVWTIVGVAVAGGTGYLIYSLNQVDYPDRDFGPVPLQ